MNSKKLILPALLLSLGAMASVPVVSNVTTTQNSARRVIVNYTLSEEPGIVTLTAQTNRGDNVWVDVDDANLTYVSGDVNKVVPVGDHSLTWLPHKSWPDQLITGGNIRIGVKAWATNAPPDYMVVSLTVSNSVSFYTSAGAIPDGVQADKYKTEYLVMRKCPAANVTWRMGSPTTENWRKNNETSHEVTLANDYYIGVYPVTQRQYELLMNARPSNFSLAADYATRPVEKVSYDDIRGAKSAGFDWPNTGHAVKADGVISKLRKLSGLDGFDLPTDAQWEFACRAGCGAALYNGKEVDNWPKSANLGVIGRYSDNGGDPNGIATTGSADANCTAANGTAKVGSYEPNAWGIYDMLGNVVEWCLDWYQDSVSTVDAENGPASGTNRVRRGGSYALPPDYCRCAYREPGGPSSSGSTTGFRLAWSAGL